MTQTPPSARTGRPRSAAVDAAILDAALDELVERGFADMTIDRVAARAGVARTTVYRRWSDLCQLCVEAVNRAMEPFPDVPAGGAVRDDLLFLMRHVRWLHTSSRFGQLLPQLAAEASRHPGMIQEYWNTYIVQRRRRFADVFHRGIAEGVIRPEADVDLVIDLMVGPMQQRALWRLDMITEGQLVSIVDLVLAGLRPARASEHPRGS